MTESTKIDYVSIVQDLRDEADLCRNETATDIADLIDEAASCIVAMASQFKAMKARAEKAEADLDRALEACKDHLYRMSEVEAERDELKRHAEAMVAHLNDGIQVDVDPEDGTQSPRSEWDFVANELVAAYRRDHKEEA